MTDLRITGGHVVSTFTGEIFEADVLVTGEAISGIVPPGTGPDAAEVIDAGGRLIQSETPSNASCVRSPTISWRTSSRIAGTSSRSTAPETWRPSWSPS
ncbi:hypothetical protein [Saccharopolyspora spinosa]|uniref:hypothetical protein n=1 Tax=Saccharopolyspora spinosa TaxID=60894 RepID=UPI0002379B69